MQALVVDDSRAMRTILSRLMTGLGFEVVQANDGAEALAVLEDGARPAVALVDWNMPVMDGLAFITRCRLNPGYGAMAFIMVTSEGEQGRIDQALAGGADSYVIKPFTAEVIARKLATLGLIPGRIQEVGS